MMFQQVNFLQFNRTKLMPPNRGHIIGQKEVTAGSQINSVFLNTRKFTSKINWQTELLKLEDAS